MSVFKRGEKSANHWHYEFTIRGVRYRGAIPEARTKAQAQAAELSIRNSVFEGRYMKRRSIPTLSKFVKDTFLPWARTNLRACESAEIRAAVLVAAFGSSRLDEITPFHVERFKRERKEGTTRMGTTRAPATVNMELGVLSRIFRLAEDNGLAVENPCRKVKRVRVDNARTRYLTREEEARLLAACEGRRRDLAPLITVALHTGMRRGEILSLTRSQIDLNRGIVNVRGGKTGKPRIVPLNEVARLALTQLCEGRLPDDLLFERVRIDTSFARVREAAGLPDFHFHDLRHTAATRLVEGGADAFTVAAILGHTNVKTTARYAHATGESMRRAVGSLEPKRESVTRKFPTTAGDASERRLVNE